MIESMKHRLVQFWKEDIYRRYLFIGGFAYAMFFAQGIPLWDDDFTSWFHKVNNNSFLYYIWNLISPISTQPQYWGFNERPIQALLYKFFYAIAGYDPTIYFLYKSAVYGGLGLMIYQWGLRLVPSSRHGMMAALAAGIFFLLTPGPMAAHILHQDLAPTAELLFLVITYYMWDQIEKTPADWQGIPKWSDPAHKSWIVRWSIIAFITYLGYKSKADLKLIPIILAGYVMLVRPKQWKFFAVPVALMLLLAVPWGPGVFAKRPPFLPGSGGSEIGWMWQEPKTGSALEFLWNSGLKISPLDLGSLAHWAKAATISLSGLLGLVLIGLVIFFGWRMEGLDKIQWTTQATPRDRARTFILCWFGAVLVAISSLPEINYIFRIRYGILTMVPAAMLLAWAFGLFVESMPRFPKWVTATAVAVLAIQCGINLNRSIVYRREMGQVMVAVDQVYSYVNEKHGNDKLTLMPDFRPYDYRPDAAKAFAEKTWLNNPDELPKNHKPFKTYVISWKPSLWDQLEMVEHFSGCRSTSMFDRIFPCPQGTGTYLMRFIGSDPLYAMGEQARAKRDIAQARAYHEQFVAKYPLNMAGHFVIGLEAFEQKDWARAEQAYATLEKYFPDHLSILYNRALALAELKQYQGAIDRLRYITEREPKNYAALVNLFYAHVKAGDYKKAKEVHAGMEKQFPGDDSVKRLLASIPS